MKQLLRSPLVLLAAIAVVRSAGFAFGILNIDESDYMIFGAGLLKGMLPYRDLVEIKPPLGYLTYLPAGLFGGMHTLPMRVLGVLWVFAAAMLLRAAARRWARDTDPEGAGWAAAWLFLLSLLCEIPSFGSELMLALPAAGALYFFARAQCPPIVGTPTISADAERSRRPLFLAAAGLCAALASLYRPQGAVVALALGLSLLAPLLARRAPSAAGGAPGPAPRGRAALDALGDALLLTLGFALPWAACAAVYAGFHQLPAFYEWVFVRNFEYAGKGAAGSALARGAQSTALCLGATIVPWVLAVRASARWNRREAGGEPSGSRAGRPYARALVLLLWLSWLAVAAGGRFYEHYYLQFATPLALLGAPEAARLARAFPSLSLSKRWALALGCALPLSGVTGYSWARGALGAYPGQEPRAREVAAFVREHSAPGETLFVWGHYTPIYVLAGRLPGTRYENTSVHMGNFDPAHLPDDFDAAKFRSARDVAATLADLRTRKPDLVVDTSPANIHDWKKVPLRAFPELAAYIEAHYRVIGHPAGAQVYRRNPDEEP